MFMWIDLPIAELFLSITLTVISVFDGLLRTSTGCTALLFSLTLYVDWLKDMLEATTWWIIQNYIINNTKSK